MKYYHLIGLSGGLLTLQFFLQNILQIQLSPFFRRLFFGAQLAIFVLYSLTFVGFLVLQRRATKRKIASADQKTKVRSKVVAFKEQEQKLRKAS